MSDRSAEDPQATASYIHATDSPINVRDIGKRTAGEFAGFFLPFLRPGSSLLDCGCGPGTITIGLADAVRPGVVVGVDIDRSQVEKAKAEALKRSVGNAQFLVANAAELPFGDSTFDAVFSHALLEHLSVPVEVLREMRRVLKIGGIVGVRSPDFGGLIVGPANAEIDAALQLYCRYRQSHGGDPFVGRKLRTLLREAGFTETSATANYKTWGTTEAVASSIDVMIDEFVGQRIRGEAVQRGWADDAFFDKATHTLRSWASSSDCFLAHASCEVVGYKSP